MKQLPFALPSRCSRRVREARSSAARRAGRYWLSDPDSPFGPRPNYTIPSGLYSVPGRKLGSIAIAALLFAAYRAAQATTISATSPSFAAVSAAISSAHNGDTVIVPAGTASWTSPLVITKGIKGTDHNFKCW